MNLINFQLVTPEKSVLSQELASLTCDTDLGQITILPGHVPLVANLVAGELHAKTTDNQDFYLFVAGGFVEVRRGNDVVILADDAEHHYAIDIQRAVEAKERAEKAMKEQRLSGQEYARVAASLQQSLAKINVARKHAGKSAPLVEQGRMTE